MILFGVILLFSISILFLFLKTETIKKTHVMNVKKMEEVISKLYVKQEMLHEKIVLTNNFKTDFDKDFKLICIQIVELQKIFIKTIFKQKNT